ncbi:hypothetical protein ARMGADRAFT_312524 [Armillaria gallica]|uniref:Uncharacterized protein n=1 Tax=Armillaria gallica TaxID=47427 RepID=A0A2H3DFR9_ARMGA|nr:hypothetical protein ARMGADRAFT_312524 [Armillaria gallica]
MVVMYIVVCTTSTDHHCCARNVWNRRSLCRHCRVILPTYLPTTAHALVILGKDSTLKSRCRGSRLHNPQFLPSTAILSEPTSPKDSIP